MAEASPVYTIPYAKMWKDSIQIVFGFIKHNSWDDLKNIFENIPPELITKILNTCIGSFIPLTVAVYYNNVGMFHYLLNLTFLYGPPRISDQWKYCRHPLIVAMEVNNPEFIETILKLIDINEEVNGISSPLMTATFLDNLTAVKLIVAMGADVNGQNFRGRIPLIESTTDSKICRFLISQGSDVNHQDEEGFTALHKAVSSNQRESVIQLVRAGADVTLRCHEGLSPLIWSTINLDVQSFKYLLTQPNSSDLDKIEAMEVLNACFICTHILDVIDLQPWRQALAVRREKSLPKDCQIPEQALLDFSREFTTFIELQIIFLKPLHLAYQGILVIERILGRNNRLYLQVLLETAVIAKKFHRMEKTKQFIEHIQEYCQEASTLVVAANYRAFKVLFVEVGEDGNPDNFFENGAFDIFKIMAQTIVKFWNLVREETYRTPYVLDSRYSELVDTFLYMTAKTKNFPVPYLGLLKEEIKKVLKEKLIFRYYHSILHHTMRLMNKQPFDSVELIKILLESGADPNAVDFFGRSPASYAVTHVPEHIRNDVLTLLYEFGGQELLKL